MSTFILGETASLTQATGRRERRRATTRARLIESARSLMARRGVDAVGIAEITENADLGTGTFYNYFQSRDEIVEAVVEDSVESLGESLDALTADLADPAEVFAVSLRHLVRRAVSDSIWGWFVVRLGVAHPQLISILGPRAARDLRQGLESGRFDIADVDVATASTFGALLGTLHLVLSTSRPGDEDSKFAQAMLAMVGISPEEAREISYRPLIPLEEG